MMKVVEVITANSFEPGDKYCMHRGLDVDNSTLGADMEEWSACSESDEVIF